MCAWHHRFCHCVCVPCFGKRGDFRMQTPTQHTHTHVRYELAGSRAFFNEIHVFAFWLRTFNAFDCTRILRPPSMPPVKLLSMRTHNEIKPARASIFCLSSLLNFDPFISSSNRDSCCMFINNIFIKVVCVCVFAPVFVVRQTPPALPHPASCVL